LADLIVYFNLYIKEHNFPKRGGVRHVYDEDKVVNVSYIGCCVETGLHWNYYSKGSCCKLVQDSCYMLYYIFLDSQSRRWI
jgi:hypothetical protein